MSEAEYREMIENGFFEEIISRIDELSHDEKKSPMYLYFHAYALLKSEKIQEFVSFTYKFMPDRFDDRYSRELLRMLGRFYINKGRYKLAEKTIKQLQEISDYTGDLEMKARALINLGIIHDIRGELKKALLAFTQAKQLKELLGQDTKSSRLNIGILQQRMGNPEKGLKLLVELEGVIGKDVVIKTHLYTAIANILYKLDKREEISNYIEKFEHILGKSSVNHDFILIHLSYVQALHLSMSDRIREKAQADTLIDLCIRSEQLEFEMKSQLIKILIEHRMIEFSFRQSDEIFLEIVTLMEDLINNSREENNYAEYIDALLLKGKFEMVKGNFTDIINIHEEIQQLIDTEDLPHFQSILDNERMQIKSDIENMLRQINDGSPLIQKFDFLRIKQYLEAIKEIKN